MSPHPKPSELDEQDLGAHSKHRFRLYGGERVWVTDVRGEPDGRPDVDIEFKNVTLSGSLSTLIEFAELLSAILHRAAANAEQWDEVPGRAWRAGVRGQSLSSPFSGRLAPLTPRT